MQQPETKDATMNVTVVTRLVMIACAKNAPPGNQRVHRAVVQLDDEQVDDRVIEIDGIAVEADAASGPHRIIYRKMLCGSRSATSISTTPSPASVEAV